jgi:hypothetical protein
MKSVCVHKRVRVEETKPNGIHEMRINADTDLLLTEYIDICCITSLQFIEIFYLQTNGIKFKNYPETYIYIYHVLVFNSSFTKCIKYKCHIGPYVST